MHLKRQSLNHYGGVGVVVLLLISLILLAACDTGYPDKVGDTKLTIEEMREVAVSISYDELKKKPK